MLPFRTGIHYSTETTEHIFSNINDETKCIIISERYFTTSGMRNRISTCFSST